MTYDEIMEQIKSGLTGDKEKDLKYIKEQQELYKDHELAQEILRGCGRLMFELLPEEAQKELSNAINADRVKLTSTLDEFHFALYKKDFARAESIIVPVVEQADNLHMFENDSVSEYFCWEEFFEEVLLREVRKSDFTIRHAEYPYAQIYLNYGSFLFELGKYEEAHEQLRKAMRWNPVRCEIRFEYMETIKQRGDTEEYGHLAEESFQYAFRPQTLARCYRNMGWYFADKKMYNEAMTCYQLSSQFVQQNPAAASEMYWILLQDPNAKPMTAEEFKPTAEQYNIPIGPDGRVLGLAFSLGKMFNERGNKEAAKYCFEIIYDLVGGDELKKLIDELSE